MTGETKRIDGLSAIGDAYELILCDVWGVLHNGVQVRSGAVSALMNFRKNGGVVIMITNAPRQRKSVKLQLTNMGVPEGTFDEVVTSGDVTRVLIRQHVENGSGNMLHIGPEKDLNLFEGIDVERVSEADAAAVICSGLWNEQTETPEDYVPLLTRLKERGLPFICANPDIVVEVGDHLEYCAGAIAREYDRLGGETLIAGKPHHPIYDTAISEAAALAGKSFDKSRILAIGDGMPTDIKGAGDYGLDALYVTAGIHAAEYGQADNPDHLGVLDFLAENRADPVAWLPRLAW